VFLFRPVPGHTQPHIQWVPRAFNLGVKRPELEADNSPPSSAEIKKAWSYASLPQYVFMAWCLIKHRDNFTFTTKVQLSFETLSNMANITKRMDTDWRVICSKINLLY